MSKAFDSKGNLVDSRQIQRGQCAEGGHAPVIYVLALLAIGLPSPASGWVKMAVGGAGMSPLLLLPMLLLALILWRVVSVWREPGRLDVPIGRGVLLWCRKMALALALMAIGVAVYLAQWLIGPIGRALFPRGSDNGVEFFVVGLGLAMFCWLAVLGVLLFEGSRLLSFERWYRDREVQK